MVDFSNFYFILFIKCFIVDNKNKSFSIIPPAIRFYSTVPYVCAPRLGTELCIDMFYS